MHKKMSVKVIWDLVKDTTSLLFFVLTLPIFLCWRLAISRFVSCQRKKSWKRVVGDTVFRWSVYTLPIPILARVIGASTRTYEKWCKRNSEHPIIDTIGTGAEQARILWIGSKYPKRVILYLHGGGFWLPMADHSVKFWRYVQDALHQQKGIDVSIAILDYSLIPDAEFPTPLRQTVVAIHHLLSNGLPGRNIQIAGDSAGGNLVLQLILHMLHPLEGVPTLPPGTKFCGAYLMSPWLYLRVRPGVKSYSENENWDVVAPTSKFTEFGDRVLAGLSDDGVLPYIDAASAPPGWYSDANIIVDRVLITGGGKECIRDDIVEFGEAFCKEHSGAQLIIDEYGVHDDPFYDFLVGEKKLSELTPKIIQWLAEGFKSSDDPNLRVNHSVT